MNKYLKCFLVSTFALMSISPIVAAKVSYISDDLSAYLRRGPGDKFGFTGTLNAGAKVTILESNGKYTRIRDDKGRVSWIESEMLSNMPSFRERIPQLEQQIASLTDKLRNASQSTESQLSGLNTQLQTSAQKMSTLTHENSALKQQLLEAQEQVEKLNDRLDEKRRDLILQWFLYGGGVAGGGLLLGLILPFLFPRKKSRGSW